MKFAQHSAHLFRANLCLSVLLRAVVYLLHLRSNDGNATFKNEFRNWTKSWFYFTTRPATTTFAGTSLWHNICLCAKQNSNK